MIPGLKAIPALNGAGSSGSGGSGGMSLTLVGYSTARDTNITIPSGAIAGDFAILFDMGQSHAGNSISTEIPSGWTSIVDTYASPGEALRTTVSYRKLTVAGGGSVSGMSGSDTCKILMVFRSSSAITTVTPSTWNGEVTSGNPTTQTVTASGITTPLIVFAWGTAGSTSTPPAFTTETPAMTNLTQASSSGDVAAGRLGYTIYNSSPSDQSIDTGDNGPVNGLQSGYVRFT